MNDHLLPALNACFNAASAAFLAAGYAMIRRGPKARHLVFSAGPGAEEAFDETGARRVRRLTLYVREGRVTAHRIFMSAAFLSSTLFMGSYLYYHAKVGAVHFNGRGAVRTVYLAILATHTVLAAVNVPLILRTLYLAWQGRFEAHRRLARWTLPSWMYVSVTGVIIYFMLYSR